MKSITMAMAMMAMAMMMMTMMQCCSKQRIVAGGAAFECECKAQAFIPGPQLATAVLLSCR